MVVDLDLIIIHESILFNLTDYFSDVALNAIFSWFASLLLPASISQ